MDDGVRYSALNEQGRGFDAESTLVVQNDTSTLGALFDVSAVTGGGSGSYTSFFTGRLAELLVFDRALPDRELRSLAFLLTQKWSLESPLLRDYILYPCGAFCERMALRLDATALEQEAVGGVDRATSGILGLGEGDWARGSGSVSADGLVGVWRDNSGAQRDFLQPNRVRRPSLVRNVTRTDAMHLATSAIEASPALYTMPVVRFDPETAGPAVVNSDSYALDAVRNNAGKYMRLHREGDF
jgi:hypothetical protein